MNSRLMVTAPASTEHEFEPLVLSVDIPPRPEILNQLGIEIRKESPNFAQVEKLIGSDVGISASLIKTINSPFYGLRNKVTSVSQAINMLGLNSISRIVTGMVLKGIFRGADPVSMERFWDASAKVALISSYLAKQLPGIDEEEAYTFGLFQDCGIPALMQRFPNYKETLGLANLAEDKIFTEIENELHGTSHNTIGYLMAKSWGLSDTITQAIHYHHEHNLLESNLTDLSIDSQNLIALALLSERTIQVNTQLDQTFEWMKGRAFVLNHFGLSESDFNGIVDDIGEMLLEEAN